MNKTAVEITKLTKSYGDFVAVNKLDLRVKEGQIFGFLGPNGAGKTTSILMLLGLTEPTSGRARVYGYDCTREPLKVKRLAGYLPEKIGFYEDLTARQNLEYVAELNNLPRQGAEARISELLSLMGLPGEGDRKVKEFSQGMKQRLGIAAVLVKNPKVAFLDEPTAGIDPEGINEVLDLVARISREEKLTVILSSHQLHQVQRISDEVGIMSKGKLVAQGPIERLGRETLGGGRVQIEVRVSQQGPQLIESIEKIRGVRKVEVKKDLLTINCDKDIRPEVARVVVDSGSLLLQMNMREYGLEEIYHKYFEGD
jgi:ABC-2 type transport system ATP-binding protein